MAEQRPILGVEITGWGSALPSESLTNAQLIDRFGLDSTPEKIEELSGIKNRYICSDEENTLTLSVQASKEALARAGVISAQDRVDALIVGTTTPSIDMPAVAPIVHEQLGLKGGFAYDVHSACTGFMTALINTYRYFPSDGAERGLAIGADQLSRITDYHDRGTGILFGDGAGAVILERTDTDSGMLGWAEDVDGSAANILYCERGKFIQMDGREVMKRAIRTMVDMSQTAIDRSSLVADDIDLVIPHQANIRIIREASKRLGIPMDKMVTTMDHHGNTSAASIPLAFDEAMVAGRIEDGYKVLMVGFGAGMTAAAAVIKGDLRS